MVSRPGASGPRRATDSDKENDGDMAPRVLDACQAEGFRRAQVGGRRGSADVQLTLRHLLSPRSWAKQSLVRVWTSWP